MFHDKVCQRTHGRERLPGDFLFLDDDAVVSFEQHHQFQRVNRVQPQPRTKQGFVIFDLLGLDLLEIQSGDNLLIQFIH